MIRSNFVVRDSNGRAPVGGSSAPRRAAFALAALVATAAVVLLGAGSASADAFCRDAANPCLEGYPAETAFATHSKSVVLKTSVYEVKCESTLEGESTADLEEGKGVTGKVTKLTFEACSGGCTEVKANNLPYAFLDSATTEGNGTAVISSGGSGNPGASFNNCTGFKVSCVYGTPEAVLEFKGGSGGSEEKDGKLIANGVKLSKVSGSLCPETATWTGTYTETKIGGEQNGGWRWWRSAPIISWSSFDYGEVTVNTTSTAITTVSTSVEVEYGQSVFSGNGEGVFASTSDNCSNQKINGNCTMETTCKPKATITYEATRELPWKRVGGGSEGTVKIRFKCKGK